MMLLEYGKEKKVDSGQQLNLKNVDPLEMGRKKKKKECRQKRFAATKNKLNQEKTHFFCWMKNDSG